MSGFSVNERFRRHYDEYYSDGDFGYKRLSRLDTTANVRELCADIAHGRVLEIGCGDGILLELLSEEGEGFVDELWGVEIAESAVEATKRRKIPKLRECSMFDGYTLKYEDDYFDLAVMSHVLEHVEYPRRLLYEAGRVAQHVFVEVPLELTVRLPDDHSFGNTGHIILLFKEERPAAGAELWFRSGTAGSEESIGRGLPLQLRHTRRDEALGEGS